MPPRLLLSSGGPKCFGVTGSRLKPYCFKHARHYIPLLKILTGVLQEAALSVEEVRNVCLRNVEPTIAAPSFRTPGGCANCGDGEITTLDEQASPSVEMESAEVDA